MPTTTRHLELSTRGHGHTLDLTGEVRRVLAEAGAREGTATVFARGSTAAVTTIEFEPGAVEDMGALLERLVPERGDYEHNRRNLDSNAYAHLRAALVGPSVSVPVEAGRLALGTWQQIVLLDFDDRPRERTVVVQIVD